MYPLDSLCRSRQWVSAVLTNVCAANMDWAVKHLPSDQLSCFDCSTPPSISIADYMRQVQRAEGGQYWPMCLILIDTLSRATLCPVSLINVHRLIATAYSLALKLSIDTTEQCRVAAGVGGVNVIDLAEMEMVFLQCLDWRTIVSPAAHEKLCTRRRLIQKTASRAAEVSRDGSSTGPITIIPDVIVPLKERFSLQIAAAAPPRSSPQEQPEDSLDSTPAEPPAALQRSAVQRALLIPSPPKQPGGSRPQAGLSARARTTPCSEIQGAADAAPMAAGSRSASAVVHALRQGPAV